MEIVTTGEVRAAVIRDGGDGNIGINFTDDLLALILAIYGRRQNYNLRLGIYMDGQRPIIINLGDDNLPAGTHTAVVWVNNAAGVHWEGMGVLTGSARRPGGFGLPNLILFYGMYFYENK
jgi:hypothetical protein